MIETLKPYYQKFEVRVESFTGAVWKLNLEFGFSLLGQLSKVCRGRPYLLSEMIAGKRGLLNEWVKCVRPMEANLSIFVGQNPFELGIALLKSESDRTVITSTPTCRLGIFTAWPP